MPLTVNFKTQRGNITNRKFELSEGVSVYGSFKSYLFTEFLGAHIRLDVLDKTGNSIFFKEDTTDFYGDYALWFRSPDFDTKATVKITGRHSGGGLETVIIPIAVGFEIPDKLPGPVKEAGLFDFLSTGNIILVVVLLLVFFGGIYLIGKK